MNILFSCAGRRNYLLNYFRANLPGEGKIFATDITPHAPALTEADDYFIVPKVQAPDYCEQLLAICRTHKIKLVISLNDLELPYLAEVKHKFLEHGIMILISEREVIDICFDKYKTADFLNNLNLGTPKTYLTIHSTLQAIANKEIAFPLIVKPRWGSASIGIEIANDANELELAYTWVKNKIQRSILNNVGDIHEAIIIQPCLKGIEYGIDIINNLSGTTEAVFIKQKLTMRAGETDRAITIHNPKIEEMCRYLGNQLGHIGNLDCDLFEVDGEYYFLEMNPRFGGGYPFSHLAGANIPGAILAWLKQEQPLSAWLTVKPNVASSKYDQLVITHG